MIVELKKPVTKEKVQKAIALMGQQKEKKSLKKHFGKLKRGIDSLAYQKKVRDGWV
jgi:hypothetical protein